MGGNPIATILAGVGGFIAGGPAGAALAIASSIYQQNQIAQAQRAADAAREANLGQEVRVSTSAAALSVHYGYSGTSGIPVFIDTNSSAQLSTQTGFSTFPTNALSDGTGVKNQFLLKQTALGLGEVDSVENILVNNIPDDEATIDGTYRTSVSFTGGVANADATAFSDDRVSTDTFTGIPYATETFKLTRDDPQFRGIPIIYYFLKGRKIIPRVSGATTAIFTTNAVDVLYDYMTDTNYGAGIAAADIDQASFISARAYGEEIVQAGATVGGLAYGTATTRDIKRYEFDGSLSTDNTVIQNIEAILASMIGSYVIRDASGTFKLSVPNVTTPLATQSVMTFDEDEMVGGISEIHPNTDVRLNQYTVRFASLSKDLKEDSVTLPRDSDALFSTLRTQDNGVKLASDQELIGISDVYHAANFALTRVRESRLRSFSWSTRFNGIRFEPGDVVRITNTAQGIAEFVRIASVKPQTDLTVAFTAVEYNLTTYGWTTEPNEVIIDQPVYDFTIPAPTNFAGVADTTTSSTINFSWTAANDATVNEYIVEARNSLSTTFSTIGVVAGLTTFSFTQTLAGTFVYRVRSKNRVGRISGPSNEVTLISAGIEAVNLIEVYRFNNNDVNTDPGAPPNNSTGTGNGWFEANPGTPDGDPHWEAVTRVEPSGGTTRLLNFTTSGVAGDVTTGTVLSNQIRDFTFTGGNTGAATFIHAARQEITQFTFSGTSSDDMLVGGNAEYWTIDTAGMSEATTSDTSEEFYIYLTGTSGAGASTTTINNRLTAVTPLLNFTNSTATSTGTFNDGSGVLEASGSWADFLTGLNVGFTPVLFIGAADATVAGTWGNSAPSGAYMLMYNDAFTSYATIQLGNVTNNGATIDCPFANRTVIQSGGTFDNTESYNMVVLPSSSNGVPDATTTGPSSVDIAIPTEGIDENFTLGGSLTTPTMLRDNLLTSMQANTNITTEFTLSADTADVEGQTNVPIVKMVANDTVDHSISVTFNNGSGDLAGSGSGSLVEGEVANLSTTIRINYDSDLTPAFQDITFGGQANAAALATFLTSAIDGHGDLNARQGTAVVNPGEGLIPGAASTLVTIPSATSADATVFQRPTPTITSGIGTIAIARPDNTGAITSTDWNDAVGNLLTLRYLAPGGGNPSPSAATFGGVGTRQVYIQDGSDTNNYAILNVTVPAGTTSVRPTINSIVFSSGVFPNATSAQFTVVYGDAIANQTGTVPTVDITESATSNRVVVFSTADRAYTTDPTITVTTAGTSPTTPSFTIANILDGSASTGTGAATSYIITRGGVEVASANFALSLTSAQMADAIDGVIDGLSQYTSAVVGSVVTATSVANEADNLLVTLTAGTNQNGTTPNAAVARVVTQSGSAVTVNAGSAGLLTVLSNGVSFASMSLSNQTSTEVATTLNSLINNATQTDFSSTITGDTVRATSAVTGTSPVITVSLLPGQNGSIDPVTGELTLTDSTQVVTTTIIDSGTSEQILTGALSTYTVTAGTTTFTTQSLAGSLTANQVATLISAFIGANVAAYSTSVIDNVITAESVVEGELDDVTVTIAAGMNADDTAATLAIAKSIVRTGQDSGADLTGATWIYFVINQGFEADDDTTMMIDNTNGVPNVITVRRGLILDSTVFTAETPFTDAGTVAGLTTPASLQTLTTGARPALLIGSANVVGFLTTTTGGLSASVDTIVEFSIDGGTTWTEAGDSFGIIVQNFSMVTSFWAVHPVVFTLTAVANTTYMWRAVIRASPTTPNPLTNILNHAGNISVRGLILEELSA